MNLKDALQVSVSEDATKLFAEMAQRIADLRLELAEVRAGLRPHRMPQSRKYPQLNTIEVGQSFFLPGPRAQRKLNGVIDTYREWRTFTVHTVTENGQTGARCLRLR